MTASSGVIVRAGGRSSNRRRRHLKRNVAGYWMYELADLQDKKPIEFEGALVDPPDKYVTALHEMNARLILALTTFKKAADRSARTLSALTFVLVILTVVLIIVAIRS